VGLALLEDPLDVFVEQDAVHDSAFPRWKVHGDNRLSDFVTQASDEFADLKLPVMISSGGGRKAWPGRSSDEQRQGAADDERDPDR
jgi:hypothetical protein